jgi:hypothetical protein
MHARAYGDLERLHAPEVRPGCHGAAGGRTLGIEPADRPSVHRVESRIEHDLIKIDIISRR